MDPNLTDATLAAPSTLGASMYPEISRMNAITAKLPTSSGVANASIGQAQQQVQVQKEAEALAKQKTQDLSDPKKYRPVKKADGGYDFFAPDGSQIDIATLTQRTQTKPSDWLSDSENPIDIQYLNDTENLQGLIKAVATKDTASLEKYKQGFADNNLPDITTSNVQDILDKYRKYYQRYYITRQENPNAWGTRPNSNPLVPAPQTFNNGLPTAGSSAAGASGGIGAEGL